MARAEEPLPAIYEPRERRPRKSPEQAMKLFSANIGFLNETRDDVTKFGYDTLEKRNLNNAVENINRISKWRADNPTAKMPALPRELPVRTGIDELYKIIQTMHNDIKFIKDAQSKVGAIDWIRRNGYQDSLYVDEKDIDNDGIPDIIIKKRSDRSPYIVKGYTTTQSDYPYRYQYYTKYPLAEDRKGHSYRDYLNDRIVSKINKDMTRTYNTEEEEFIKKERAVGYKMYAPPKKIGVATAFNTLIIKPVIDVIKANAKRRNIPLILDGTTVRQIEAYIRANVISIPVLKVVYGDDIMQQNQEIVNKLLMKRDIQDACREIVSELLAHREDIAQNMIKAVTDILISIGKMQPPANTEQADTFANEVYDSLIGEYGYINLT
jgi:hypothetical protein